MTFHEALLENVGKWMTLNYGTGYSSGGYVGNLERVESDFVVMEAGQQNRMHIHLDSVTSFICHPRPKVAVPA